MTILYPEDFQKVKENCRQIPRGQNEEILKKQEEKKD